MKGNVRSGRDCGTALLRNRLVRHHPSQCGRADRGDTGTAVRRASADQGDRKAQGRCRRRRTGRHRLHRRQRKWGDRAESASPPPSMRTLCANRWRWRRNSPPNNPIARWRRCAGCSPPRRRMQQDQRRMTAEIIAPLTEAEEAAVILMLLDDAQATPASSARLEPDELDTGRAHHVEPGRSRTQPHCRRDQPASSRRPRQQDLPGNDRMGRFRHVMTQAVGQVKADSLLERIAPGTQNLSIELARWLAPDVLGPHDRCRTSAGGRGAAAAAGTGSGGEAAGRFARCRTTPNRGAHRPARPGIAPFGRDAERNAGRPD